MDRYIVAAQVRSENDSRFPVEVWVVDADGRVDARRRAADLWRKYSPDHPAKVAAGTRQVVFRVVDLDTA